uniref:Leucine-rich repeat-containing N-terminal plant-type domain-containing protein n=1 Tax=Pseudo-nitzschia australis TaxID=44445 RepID=A0A7S4AKE1_9STRA
MASPVGEVVMDLLPHSSLKSVRADPSGPQSRAFAYVVEHQKDLLVGSQSTGAATDVVDEQGGSPVPMPPLSPFDRDTVRTVFSLVTLYYSLDGPNWYVAKNWLDPRTNICDWHGIDCRDEPVADANASASVEGTMTGTTAVASDHDNDDENDDNQPPGRQRQLRGGGPPTTAAKRLLQEEEESEDGDNDEHEFEYDDDDDDDDYPVEDTAGVDLGFGAVDPPEGAQTHNAQTHTHTAAVPIRGLQLKANNLSGELPRELGMLTNADHSIDLQTNDISGPIPPKLRKLKRLRALLLNDNALSSTIPPDLGRMTSLQRFDVSGNPSIGGALPSSLGAWQTIEELKIHGTGLSGAVPTELCDTIQSRVLANETLRGVLDVRASCAAIECPCCTECCDTEHEHEAGVGVGVGAVCVSVSV